MQAHVKKIHLSPAFLLTVILSFLLVAFYGVTSSLYHFVSTVSQNDLRKSGIWESSVQNPIFKPPRPPPVSRGAVAFKRYVLQCSPRPIFPPAKCPPQIFPRFPQGDLVPPLWLPSHTGKLPSCQYIGDSLVNMPSKNMAAKIGSGSFRIQFNPGL